MADMDLALLEDSHRLLTERLLPLALKKMEEVLTTKPVRGDPKAKVRLLSLQARTAIACTNMVIHLGDAALKRRAGSQLDQLLEQVRRNRPDLFAETIDQTKMIEADPESLDEE